MPSSVATAMTTDEATTGSLNRHETVVFVGDGADTRRGRAGGHRRGRVVVGVVHDIDPVVRGPVRLVREAGAHTEHPVRSVVTGRQRTQRRKVAGGREVADVARSSGRAAPSTKRRRSYRQRPRSATRTLPSAIPSRSRRRSHRTEQDPVRSIELADVGAVVAGSLVEADRPDETVGVGAELHAELERRAVGERGRCGHRAVVPDRTRRRPRAALQHPAGTGNLEIAAVVDGARPHGERAELHRRERVAPGPRAVRRVPGAATVDRHLDRGDDPAAGVDGRAAHHDRGADRHHRAGGRRTDRRDRRRSCRSTWRRQARSRLARSPAGHPCRPGRSASVAACSRRSAPGCRDGCGGTRRAPTPTAPCRCSTRARRSARGTSPWRASTAPRCTCRRSPAAPAPPPASSPTSARARPAGARCRHRRPTRSRACAGERTLTWPGASAATAVLRQKRNARELRRHLDREVVVVERVDRPEQRAGQRVLRTRRHWPVDRTAGRATYPSTPGSGRSWRSRVSPCSRRGCRYGVPSLAASQRVRQKTSLPVMKIEVDAGIARRFDVGAHPTRPVLVVTRGDEDLVLRSTRPGGDRCRRTMCRTRRTRCVRATARAGTRRRRSRSRAPPARAGGDS